MSENKSVTEIYNRLAPTYDKPIQLKVLNMLVKKLKPETTLADTVLEVGFGTGLSHTAVKTLMPAKHYVGVDLTDAMLKKAQTKNLGASLVQANALELPFGDNSMDGVCCFLTLCDIKDPVNFVNEVARVIKPGGKLMLGGVTLPFTDETNLAKTAVNSIYSGFEETAYGATKADLMRNRVVMDCFTQLGFDVQEVKDFAINQIPWGYTISGNIQNPPNFAEEFSRLYNQNTAQ